MENAESNTKLGEFCIMKNNQFFIDTKSGDFA